MDPAIAYEMRLRFRQDMAAAFGDEWRPERLPKLEPVEGCPTKWVRSTRPQVDVRQRVITMRQAGYSLERISRIAAVTEERAWAILARWAPDLLPEREVAA